MQDHTSLALGNETTKWDSANTHSHTGMHSTERDPLHLLWNGDNSFHGYNLVFHA